MPWEKSFDRDLALDRAMGIFWSRGYEATSMQHLVEGMGINRGSLYHTFASKRELFLETLRRYDARCRAIREAAVDGSPTPVAAIAALFKHWIDFVLADDSRGGCFLTNTALEVAAHDDEIGALVARSQRETEGFFKRLIDDAQTRGEIASELDARHAARALLGSLLGMLVLARSRPERALLQSIADSAVAALR